MLLILEWAVFVAKFMHGKIDGSSLLLFIIDLSHPVANSGWLKQIGCPDVDLLLTKTLTDRLTAPILTVKNGIKFIKEGHAIF